MYIDELVCVVAAANIAGHMEANEKIVFETDEELLYFIRVELEKYEKHCSSVRDEDWSQDDWYTWIEKAFVRDYGIEN